jgi:ribosomal protein S18 acetylase RimI-like enzyme
MTSIRIATPDDVPGIAAVIKDSLGEDLNQDYCRLLLASREYIVRVADAGDDILGLVGGFVSSTTGAVRRWEVDLLAVRSHEQNAGLGTKLLVAAWDDAEANQVKFARGLTKIGNDAAKTCFERAGYTSNGTVFDMIQWTPANFDAGSTSRSMISLLPVETLIYQGVWIEGLDNVMVSDDDRENAVKAGRAMALSENRDHATAVVPADKPLSANVMSDGVMVGQYQWWRKP